TMVRRARQAAGSDPGMCASIPNGTLDARGQPPVSNLVGEGFAPLRGEAMWTGRQTLGSIETAIGKLYREETQLDASLKSAVAEAERLRKERAEALRELARVKLD